MYRKWLAVISALFLSAASLSGCGSDTGGLATSSLSATTTTGILDSDVANWVDSTTNAKSTTWTGSYTIPAADSVNVTVQSTAYTSSSGTATTPLPVQIDSATITFSPADSLSPAIQTQYQVLGSVLSGGSVSIPVRVVSQELKQVLAPALANNSIIYNYYVTIALHVTENGAGKSATVSTKLQVYISDFIN